MKLFVVLLLVIICVEIIRINVSLDKEIKRKCEGCTRCVETKGVSCDTCYDKEIN